MKKELEKIDIQVQWDKFRKYEIPFYTKLKTRRGLTANETLIMWVLLTHWWLTAQGCILQNGEIWNLVWLGMQYASNLVLDLKEKKIISISYEGVKWPTRKLRRIHIVEDLRAFTY